MNYFYVRFHMCTGKCKCKVHPIALQAQRGSKVQVYPFFNLGARRLWVIKTMPQPLYARERGPVPIVQEVGWAPGRVCTSAEYVTPHQDSIPGTSKLWRVAARTTQSQPTKNE